MNPKTIKLPTTTARDRSQVPACPAVYFVLDRDAVRYNRAVKAQITALPAKLPRIVVYLPEELKADLERLAKSHYRPVSNMVLTLIQEAVDEAKSEGRIQSDDRSQQQKSDSDSG